VTSTTTTPASGPTTTAEAVNFIEVGVKLYVTPTIHKDQFITMKVKPEISSVTRNVITSNNNSIPVVETSEAETTVTVKNGVTIFIGGLIRDELINSHSRVPVLGSIPFIGVAFRGDDEFTRKTETVIFLTPKIITGDVPARDVYMARERLGVISPEPSKIFQQSHEPVSNIYVYGDDDEDTDTRSSEIWGATAGDRSYVRSGQPYSYQDSTTPAATSQRKSAKTKSSAPSLARGGSASVLGTIRRVNNNLTFVIIHLNQSAALTIGDSVDVYRESQRIAKLEVTKIRGELVAATIKDQAYDIKIGDIIK
ncbi:MAG: type II and III secretion system protein, partial [Candidatus Omnitrophica bacterium]|nr:type II and III secretion system protein [Candidatus Omnitrophota bacterium]